MFAQLKKISLVSFGNIFNAILGVAFLTSVARTLPLEDFGKYAFLTTLLVSMSKIIDFGSNSVFVAQGENQNPQKIKLETFITLKIILLIITIMLGVLVLTLLGLGSLPIITIYILGLIAYGINLIAFTYFQKAKMYKHAVALNTIPATIKGLLAILILFSLLQISLTMAFAIFSLSMYSCILVALKLPSKYKKISLNFEQVKSLAFMGAPGGIAIIIQNSWPTISNTIAKVIKDFSNAGIFSVAEKVANIFTLISISAFTVLLPENAQRKKDNLKYDFKGASIIGTLILLMGIFTTVIGKILLPKAFGNNFEQSIDLLGVLIGASAFTAIHTFLDNYFYVENKVSYVMATNIAKITIFISLGIILTQKFNLIGLAFSQLISAISAFVLTIIFILYLEKKRNKITD